MRSSRTYIRRILCAGAVLLAACTGRLGEPIGPGDGPICNGVEPGPSPIRRMTRVEYNNTIRDLLGDDTGPADGFVPEEEALGFSNNAYALGVTQLLAEQYMVASEGISARAIADLGTLLPCDPVAAGEDACAAQFVAEFGKRAFRRPLTTVESDALLALYTWGKAEYDFTTGIELVIQAALQSPHFLYRVELGDMPAAADEVVALNSWEVASRLSYLIWGSMPDEELFAAAEAGTLTTADEVAVQARRMLEDPRARATVAGFHAQWLKLGAVAALEKDPTVFPDWDDELGPLFLEETRLYLDDAFWNGGTLMSLFTASHTFMNARLAAFYGITDGAPAGETFELVPLDPAQRVGFLTQGSILASNAKPNQTSPVHRGKFVREQLLCQMLPAPPDDIDIVPPDLDPTLTTRERFAEHSENEYCAGCHRLMDPIGFGFEAFDGTGKWRDTENGLAIDVSGELISTLDIDGPFAGVSDLSYKLAMSTEVRACVTKQWFRFAYGRGETTRDACTMEALVTQFADSDYSMKELLFALTQTDAFLYRRAGGAQ